MRQLGFADHLVSGLDQAVQALSYVRTCTYGILAVLSVMHVSTL